jgi:predicted GIY-YIG superfamily endonuclease
MIENEMDNQQPRSEKDKVQRLSHRGVLNNINSNIIWETPSTDNNKVYLYFLKANDKVRYVGITTNITTRLSHHITNSYSSNTHKSNWIKKCIKNNITINMVIVEAFDSYEEALKKEKYYINSLEDLTNICKDPTAPNSKKCFIYDLKHQNVLSFNTISSAASYLNVTCNALYRKVIKGRYLFSYSDDFKNIIFEKYTIKSYNSVDDTVSYYVSYAHAAWVLKCSISTINLVLMNKRKTIRNKILLSKKDESFKYSNLKSDIKKKIKCITDNKEFSSIKEASEYYNIDSSLITKVCKGKRKTTNKLKFEYCQ